MTFQQAVYDIDAIVDFIESKVNKVTVAASVIQKKVYELMKKTLLNFEQDSGRIVTGQDLRKRLIEFEDECQKLFGVRVWDNPVSDFLNSFETIQERNVRMQLDYNQIKVNQKLITPARLLIFEQAKYQLKEALAPQYIQPAKFLLMQQGTAGLSIKDALIMLKRWDKGELTNGKYTNNMPAPNLQRYATQVARDTAYIVDRQINSIIKEKYDLGSFIYAGGIIKDSRELCVHLVSLDREIAFDELPPLLKKYPNGLIADTTKENFAQRCGGYSCRHKCFPVKTRKK